MARIFISAPHKSSGKTTVSIGLCAALQQQGLQVQPFKKGPDYIDPLWLTAASQRACHNLDFNTMLPLEIQQTVQHYAQDADIAIIEANKGLYDGMALSGKDSNAALAKLLQTPVVLVVDARGMTRGIAPLLMGYQAFDKQVNIAGIILNRTGGTRHIAKLRESIEHYTDIKVLGAIANSASLEIEERHLGLMPSNEVSQASQQIAQIAQQVGDQVDLALFRRLAQQTPVLNVPALDLSCSTQPKVRIGICQDAAFGFYYPSDIAALQRAGAELVPINTLQAQHLPPLDGLFIGGGFPETHMQALSANRSMRTAIYQAIENGLPTYAECGGLMYLSRSIQWQGQQAAMVGIIPGDAVMHSKPQGRGYVQLTATEHMPWAQPYDNMPYVVKAHEFHYSRLENLSQQGTYAFKMLRGTGIDGEHDGWVYKNLLASYTHLRDTSQCHWASRFVEFVRSKKI